MIICLFHLSRLSIFFFFNAAPTTEIYTLSLHDALPISLFVTESSQVWGGGSIFGFAVGMIPTVNPSSFGNSVRSEEHTSELQSHSDLVCRLLLEKKKDRADRDIDRGARSSWRARGIDPD